jgi:hypothetical protein
LNCNSQAFELKVWRAASEATAAPQDESKALSARGERAQKKKKWSHARDSEFVFYTDFTHSIVSKRDGTVVKENTALGARCR